MSASPKVAGVALIAADTGRVLMLQRAHDDPKDPAAGTWEFPGGHIEPSDRTTLHAAQREWEEEVGRRVPKGAHVAGSWTSPDGVYAGHVLTVPSEDQVNLAGRRVVDNPDDDSEQRAWWQIEHAKKNPALRPEVRNTPWHHLSRIAREAQKRMNTKDVYAAMAPATYTRTLGSGVGRSPTTIEAMPRRRALSTAIRRVRRQKPRSGSKALTQARARLETKLDPEVLEIFQQARAETKVRHVRTASGVRRYHAPIGTPIVGGHAIVRVPAGGGRGSGGGSVRKPSSSSPLGRRNPLTGRRAGGASGVGGLRKTRGKVRRAVPGNGGGMNGGGFGGGGLGGLLGGGLGSLFGGGKQPAAGKQPKQKKPPKGKKPAAAKKGKTGANTGAGKGKQTNASTGKTTTPKPTQGQLDQAVQQLLLIPPERLGGVLHTLPYDVLGDLLTTIQDPRFKARAIDNGIPAGSKALLVGAGWLEVKEPRPAEGDERCMGCGVDLDDTYDTIPSGKGYELVVCVPCAAETKAAGRGSGDSGIPGHLPEQLRRYWTIGKGKARWAASPHPYTALVDGLRSEGVPGRVIHGLAANLFRDVFGIFPAQRPRALGGSTHGYAR